MYTRDILCVGAFDVRLHHGIYRTIPSKRPWALIVRPLICRGWALTRVSGRLRWSSGRGQPIVVRQPFRYRELSPPLLSFEWRIHVAYCAIREHYAVVTRCEVRFEVS